MMSPKLWHYPFEMSIGNHWASCSIECLLSPASRWFAHVESVTGLEAPPAEHGEIALFGDNATDWMCLLSFLL